MTTGRPGSPNRTLENPREATRPGNPPANNGRTFENRTSESRKETNRPGKPPANNARTFEDRPPSSRPSNAPRVNPGFDQNQQRELAKMSQRQDAHPHTRQQP